MKWIVNDPFGFATSLRSFAGANLTLTNSSAVDVYYDVQTVASTLNTTLPGAIPVGTKIAASGGFINFQEAPRELWVRSATQTVLDVQSNAPESRGNMKVYAGDDRGSNNVTPKPPFQMGVGTASRIVSKNQNLGADVGRKHG